MAVGAPPGPRPGPGRADQVDRSVESVMPPPRRPGPGVIHALRIVDLAVARQRLGAVPQARQRGRAAGVGDGPHEPLALLVLLHLQVHAGDPQDRPLERRPPRPALVEPGADPLDVRDQVLADLVHDVVAEPLEQAHHGLGLAEQRALFGAHQPLHPVAAVASRRAAARPRPRIASRPIPRASAPNSVSWRSRRDRQVRAEPRVRLELEGVGRLVEGDPGPERSDRHAERPRRAADVLLDEQESARVRPRSRAARGRTGPGRAGP